MTYESDDSRSGGGKLAFFCIFATDSSSTPKMPYHRRFNAPESESRGLGRRSLLLRIFGYQSETINATNKGLKTRDPM